MSLKKIFFFLALISLTSLVSAATYANCGAVPSSELDGRTCIPITSTTCNSTKLDQSNSYYLLMNNITANNSCFYMVGENIVLNLNKYTINYAVNGSTVSCLEGGTGNVCHYGIYSSWGSNNAPDKPFAEEYGNTVNSPVIKNGSIIDGSKESFYSHAIYFSYVFNVEIYDLNIFGQGEQTSGIIISGAENAIVHDVNITLDSAKADPCSHYSGHISGVYLVNEGGQIEIYNNKVMGKGMIGIHMTECGNWNSNTPALIHNNYISQWSPVRDGYAIAMSAANGGCSDGTKIYNNTINQINGRGIAVAGNDYETDNGVGNVEIYGNNITVREGWDCEYDGSGTGTGIRVRFGAHNIYAHDNFIYGFAGKGVAVGSHPTKDGSKTIGLYVGNGGPYGKNNVYENNYIEVTTNYAGYGYADTTYAAIGIYEGGRPADSGL
ncbi:MAG: hypothetical protein COX63_00805, partial [Candidatus Diapherotrites archaeon CG_4_10_14_0_2_um_filter_31_5]